MCVQARLRMLLLIEGLRGVGEREVPGVPDSSNPTHF